MKPTRGTVVCETKPTKVTVVCETRLNETKPTRVTVVCETKRNVEIKKFSGSFISKQETIIITHVELRLKSQSFFKGSEVSSSRKLRPFDKTTDILNAVLHEYLFMIVIVFKGSEFTSSELSRSQVSRHPFWLVSFGLVSFGFANYSNPSRFRFVSFCFVSFRKLQ